jgi:nitrite reductase/ring-hydroxylating ferredoxin subunit
MARTCDIERCSNKGSYDLESPQKYVLCTKHAEQWRSTGMRLRTNPKKHTLRLVEVTVSDGY